MFHDLQSVAVASRSGHAPRPARNFQFTPSDCRQKTEKPENTFSISSLISNLCLFNMLIINSLNKQKRKLRF
jgi:hypothetical protein